MSDDIEDIEAARLAQGIDDVELRLEVRALRVGDVVRLTFLAGKAPVTREVRITQIRGSDFRGKLIKKAAKRRAGDLVIFSTAHIHSVVRCKEASLHTASSSSTPE
jgi:hypothetical protein